MLEWRTEALDKSLHEGINAHQILEILLADKNVDTSEFDGLNSLQKYEKMRGYIKREKAKLQNALQPTQIFENKIPNKVINKWNGCQTIKFALMGDTQFNSKYTQITYLHQFYDICAEQGIQNVYHTGDIDEGEQMRMGHQYECYTQGADEHAEEIIKNYPKRGGITTHFITGNHDASIYKKCGVDIGKMIANKRSDMEYLGRDCAIIQLTPNCTLELRHPWDGTAYAMSYKIQKMVEAMESDGKPNILAVGHYHKAEYFFYRNVHTFQTACFQSATPFTLGKGIRVELGGWIVEIKIDTNGTIQQIIPQFIPFYKGIKDDYKNWK